MLKTVILLGPRAMEFAKSSQYSFLGIQDLAPMHVNCVRVLIVGEEGEIPAMLVRIAKNYGVYILHDDYTTYGLPQF